MYRGIIACLALLCASGATAKDKPAVDATVAKLLSMTPQDFATRVSIRDDDLETAAVFTTEPAFRFTQGGYLTDDDTYARAIVDKKTGAVIYQLIEKVGYFGDWRMYDTINYEGLDGVQSAPTINLGREVVKCPSYTNRCKMSETIGFGLTPALVQALTNAYRPYDPATKPAALRFKIKGRYVDADTPGLLTPAEMAGLVTRVNLYLVQRGFKPTP